MYVELTKEIDSLCFTNASLFKQRLKPNSTVEVSNMVLGRETLLKEGTDFNVLFVILTGESVDRLVG